MIVRCKMAAAAVAGSAHTEQGSSCEDYVAVRRAQGRFAIALADGAGSAIHARLGARTVVSSVLRLLMRDLSKLLALEQAEVAAHIVGRLQRALGRQAERQNSPLHHLASTLLFAATDGEHFLCGQLGDGRIARFDANLSRAQLVFEPHKGEFFNETLFVTATEAARHLQLMTGNMHEVGGFALLSDGAEESLYQRAQASFAPALPRMMGWLSLHSSARVKRALDKNLSNTLRQRTSDDVSLALLSVQRTQSDKAVAASQLGA